MEPKHKRSLSAKEDAEAAQLVADLPLDEVVADVRGFTFLDDAKVPRYRLALERAVFASSVRDVPARAHGPAAASATSASAAPPAGAGLGINRVLAHMAGNKTVSAVRPRQRRRPDSDSDSDAGGGAGGAAGFVSASDQYAKDIRGGKVPGVTSAPKRAPKRKGFVAPGRPGEDPGASRAKRGGERDPSSGAASAPREGTLASLPPEEMPEVLRNLEPRMIEMIENEIMDRGGSVRFEDIGEEAPTNALPRPPQQPHHTCPAPPCPAPTQPACSTPSVQWWSPSSGRCSARTSSGACARSQRVSRATTPCAVAPSRLGAPATGPLRVVRP